MFSKIVAALLVGTFGLAYKKIQPPPPKICGTPTGPPVTSPRIKLRDGRYLAYKEKGVAREKANYRIVLVHGFGSSKDFNLPASQELVEELGIYFLLFDRAGYGESDPNPKRSVKSDAFDIQELANQLELGSKFYLIGASIGGYSVWSCLKHIPHRLAGVTLVAPIINYWWPSFPASVSSLGYKSLPIQYQLAFRVAHYAPGLLYWWLTQQWFLPSFSSLDGNPAVLSNQDIETFKKMEGTPQPDPEKTTQQGVFESLHRDIIVGYTNWDFDPLELKNPYPENQGCVHIWHGCEDRMIPVILQRYVSQRLPWIRYHEVPDAGHFLVHEPVFADAILKELLIEKGLSIAS